MKRRHFLRNMIPATAILTSLVNGFTVKAFGASGIFESLAGAADNNNVFVLIQLSGGSDVLKNIVPVANYSDYLNLRKNIAIPEGKVLPLNGYSKAGLHPSMTGM